MNALVSEFTEVHSMSEYGLFLRSVKDIKIKLFVMLHEIRFVLFNMGRRYTFISYVAIVRFHNMILLYDFNETLAYMFICPVKNFIRYLVTFKQNLNKHMLQKSIVWLFLEVEAVCIRDNL